MAETAAEALARLYDLDLSEDPGDLDLLLALAARAGGPVLELASGSGRLTIPLARAGHDVTGVDLDPAMLARARLAADQAGAKVARRIRLVHDDARTVRLDDAGTYALAVIPPHSIFLMGSPPDQAAPVSPPPAPPPPGGPAVGDAGPPGPPGPGRAGDGRRGAPGRGGPRRVRRPRGPRRAPRGPRGGSHGDQDGERDLRPRTLVGPPHDDLGGGPPGRPAGPLGPRRPPP